MEKVLAFLRKMRYYCNDFIVNERCHYALTLRSGISGGGVMLVVLRKRFEGSHDVTGVDGQVYVSADELFTGNCKK